MVQDIFRFGNNGYGPAEMNALLQGRGFKKDPELVKKHAFTQKNYEEFAKSDRDANLKKKQDEEKAEAIALAKEKA